MDTFWEWFWLVFAFMAFVAYIFAIFMIVVDLFRDKALSGWWKAVWLIFLILFPVLTALVYLIARGAGMSRRSAAEAEQLQQAQDSYIREVAGSKSPAEHIADAKALLDAGTISQEEFDALKAKALS